MASTNDSIATNKANIKAELDEASKLLDDTTVLSKSEVVSNQGAGVLTGAPELGADQGYGSIQAVLPFAATQKEEKESGKRNESALELTQTDTEQARVVNAQYSENDRASVAVPIVQSQSVQEVVSNVASVQTNNSTPASAPAPTKAVEQQASLFEAPQINVVSTALPPVVAEAVTDDVAEDQKPTQQPTQAPDSIAPTVSITDITMTSDNTPALHGTVDDPTATVIVTINGQSYTAVNNGDGTWTLADNAVAAIK